jgi:uncharacterized protein (DUF983 family)
MAKPTSDKVRPGPPTKELRPLTTGRLLLRGLARRCPLCGAGGSFCNYFTMKDRCPRCNLRFDRIDGQRAGALGMNTIVTFGMLAIVVVGGLVLTYPDFNLSILLPAAIAVALLVPVLFYPFSRTLWNSIDLAMRPVEPRDEVDWRWVPPPVRRR